MAKIRKTRTRKPARRARRPAPRKPARKKVEAVPKAYGSVTAILAIRDCAKAIEFYRRVFGAKELSRMAGPDGKVMHAEVKIGDRIVMMGEESPDQGAPSPQGLGGSAVGLVLYVPGCDAVFARAVAAGATAKMPPADMFWGDRYSTVVDPFGHRWGIATHTADLTPAQVAKGQAEWMAKMAAGGQP
ncbi:MAG TPA: VOC family protein [Anaeromyxobacteraceae bacterium]